MNKRTVALLVGSCLLLAAGCLLVSRLLPQFFADDVVPPAPRAASGGIDGVNPEAPANPASEVPDASRAAVPPELGGHEQGGNRALVGVYGRVVNAEGQPVDNATVWLDPRRAERRAGDQDPTEVRVQTSADGTFYVSGMVLGDRRVSLRVSHPDYALAGFDRTLDNLSESQDVGSRTLVAELGDLTMAVGAELRGRVTDLQGNGLAAATVLVEPQNRNRWRLDPDRDRLLPVVLTDAGGYYRLPHLPTGEWCVIARATQCTRVWSPLFVALEGKLTQLDDIRLGPAYELMGLVQNAMGEPVADAVVMLLGDNGMAGDAQVNEPRRASMTARERKMHAATTDAQGRFRIEHVPATKMRIEAKADGYLDYAQTGIAAASNEPLLITMRNCLQVIGSVVDAAAGQPVTNYAIRAFRLRGLEAAQATTSDRGDARSQDRERSAVGAYAMSPPEPRPDGRFVIGGLQEGHYEIAVRSLDHAFLHGYEIEVRADREAEALTLRLERGHQLLGVVVADDYQPVAGAEIVLHSPLQPGPLLSAKTNQHGEFVVAHVAAGNYQLRAKADGFDAPAAMPIELLGDRADCRVVLVRLGGLTGNVVGVRPDELAKVRVFAARRGGSSGSAGAAPEQLSAAPVRVAMEVDGTYSIRDLAPGEYVMRAYLSSDPDATAAWHRQAASGELVADVTVQGGRTSQFDCRLFRQPAGMVTGLVLHNGVAAAGFRVELLAAVDGATAKPADTRATIGSGGTFKIDKVAVGQYVLRVQSTDRTTVHEETIVVVADGTVDREIRILTSSLKGTVTTDDGSDASALNGEAILFAGLSELPANFRLDRGTALSGALRARLRAGVCEFAAVSPGEYLLVVTIPDRALSAVAVVIAAGATQQVNVPAGAVVVGGGRRVRRR